MIFLYIIVEYSKDKLTIVSNIWKILTWFSIGGSLSLCLSSNGQLLSLMFRCMSSEEKPFERSYMAYFSGKKYFSVCVISVLTFLLLWEIQQQRVSPVRSVLFAKAGEFLRLSWPKRLIFSCQREQTKWVRRKVKRKDTKIFATLRSVSKVTCWRSAQASMCSPAVRWRHVVGDDDDDDEVCSYGLGYGRCLNVTLGPCCAVSDLLHTSN